MRKTLLVFLMILLQSMLAVSAGIAAIYLSAGKSVPEGVLAGEVQIGGLEKTDAEDKIAEYYNKKFLSQKLELVIDGTKFYIPFADFDARVDGGASLGPISGWRSAAWFPDIISAYFGQENIIIKPVVKFNEGKLREKLIELSGQVDKEPVDASAAFVDGRLVKKAETVGMTLNIGYTADAIRDALSQNPGLSVTLSSSRDKEIQIKAAKVSMKDLEDIQQVIAFYSTNISDSELTDSIKLSSEAVNGIILMPSGSVGSSEFSFVSLLKEKDADFENDSEGFDQVASTLYAAVLSAGIDRDAITRLPHKLAVDYIDPGLDAWISGNARDLKFSNTLAHKVAIFTEIKGDRLTVMLAGDPSDIKGKYELKTEITQKFAPPFVNVEDKSLKPGEKVILSQGRQGVLVNVYRNSELISTDKYEAEKTIVQVGPETDWSSDQK